MFLGIVSLRIYTQSLEKVLIVMLLGQFARFGFRLRSPCCPFSCRLRPFSTRLQFYIQWNHRIVTHRSVHEPVRIASPHAIGAHFVDRFLPLVALHRGIIFPPNDCPDPSLTVFPCMDCLQGLTVRPIQFTISDCYLLASASTSHFRPVTGFDDGRGSAPCPNI